MPNMARKKLPLAIIAIIFFSATTFTLQEASGLDDTKPPQITNVNWSPRYPSTDDSVSVSARITDESGVAWAKLTYCVGTSCFFADMSGSGGNYYTSIGPFSEGGVSFSIIARDNAGNMAESSEYSFTVDGTNPTVQVLYPNGGATVAGTITITWDAYDNKDPSPSITIDYSVDTGTTWKHIAQLSGVEKYDWDTVPIG